MRSNREWPGRLWGPLRAGSSDNLPPGSRAVLFVLLGAAFVLRISVAFAVPNIHQADEVYQAAEQATHALRGYGIVSWEFQTASRPAFLATVVKPIYGLNVSAETHQHLVEMLFSALSLVPVWVAFHWAGRLYGTRGGLVAGAFMATWFELVYFAPKPTADTVSAVFLLLGIFLARPAASSRSLFIAAFAIVLALGIRIQLLPAGAVVLTAIALAHGRRRALPIVGGGAAALVLVGLIEWAWWGVPFRGHWGYLAFEFTYNVSSTFGREPLTFFAKNYVLIYGGALPVIAALVLLGARRAPILLLVIIALVVPFHFIAHKEYRFMAAAIAPTVLLMGLGATDVLSTLGSLGQLRTLGILFGGWLIAMVAMSLGDTFRPYWTKSRNHIYAFREIGQQADACGVALWRIRWYHTPGYSGLGRNISIYEMLSPEDMVRLIPAANYILAATKAPAPPPPYVAWREYSRPGQYLYRRSGECTPDSEARVERPPIPVGPQ